MIATSTGRPATVTTPDSRRPAELSTFKASGVIVPASCSAANARHRSAIGTDGSSLGTLTGLLKAIRIAVDRQTIDPADEATGHWSSAPARLNHPEEPEERPV